MLLERGITQKIKLIKNLKLPITQTSRRQDNHRHCYSLIFQTLMTIHASLEQNYIIKGKLSFPLRILIQNQNTEHFVSQSISQSENNGQMENFTDRTDEVRHQSFTLLSFKFHFRFRSQSIYGFDFEFRQALRAIHIQGRRLAPSRQVFHLHRSHCNHRVLKMSFYIQAQIKDYNYSLTVSVIQGPAHRIGLQD